MERIIFMKTAIVTGASSGIGFEISKVLIKNEIKVYGIGRNFKKNINSDLFFKVICDLKNIKETINVINNIKKENNISMLINNAGVGYFGPYEEINTNKIQDMVTINIEVPLIITQLLLRDIKKNKGTIINISSVTASQINTHGCAYGATKAALKSFSNSLFAEVRKYGVKVINIEPEIVKTDFYKNADFEQADDEYCYLLPEDIAKTVDNIINQRDEIVISEVIIRSQKHKIQRKNTL